MTPIRSGVEPEAEVLKESERAGLSDVYTNLCCRFIQQPEIGANCLSQRQKLLRTF